MVSITPTFDEPFTLETRINSNSLVVFHISATSSKASQRKASQLKTKIEAEIVELEIFKSLRSSCVGPWHV